MLTPNVYFENCFNINNKKFAVFHIIMKLKDKIATGFDGVSIKIFKKVVEYIIDRLTSIYNLCLRNGIFSKS